MKMTPSCSSRPAGSKHVLLKLKGPFENLNSGQVTPRSDHGPSRSLCIFSEVAQISFKKAFACYGQICCLSGRYTHILLPRSRSLCIIQSPILQPKHLSGVQESVGKHTTSKRYGRHSLNNEDSGVGGINPGTRLSHKMQTFSKSPTITVS